MTFTGRTHSLRRSWKEPARRQIMMHQYLYTEKQEQAKILSRREMFEEMKKNNPAIAKLQQLFDLELA